MLFSLPQILLGRRHNGRNCSRRISVTLTLSIAILVLYIHWQPYRGNTMHSSLSPKVRRKGTNTMEKANTVPPGLKDSSIMANMAEQRPRYKFILEPRVDKFKNYDFIRQEQWASASILKSAVGNRDRRDAIRDTWGSQHLYNGCRFFTFFIVGKPGKNDSYDMESIIAEHEKFGDFLMVDMLDLPRHVPQKTLASMQWASDYLPEHWIYSTADDDMILHIPNFSKYIGSTISKYSPVQSNLEESLKSLPIMCIYSYQKKDPPARDPKSKWYMPIERYAPKHWPPYCRGGWYSVPVKLAGKLYEISRWMEYLHLDDVWITGLMRIKYASAFTDENSVMDVLLDAAPLSLRTDKELADNSNEIPSQVIVSHAWGNIKSRKVDVPAKLRYTWRKWSEAPSKISD